MKELELLEWTKLNRKIQKSATMLNFRNFLLKIDWPASKLVYNIHNSNALKLITRLRLGLSNLNEHKFNYNFKCYINSLCPCSLEVKSVLHFFLLCRYFTDFRKTLFHELQSVDKIFWISLIIKWRMYFFMVVVSLNSNRIVAF